MKLVFFYFITGFIEILKMSIIGKQSIRGTKFETLKSTLSRVNIFFTRLKFQATEMCFKSAPKLYQESVNLALDSTNLIIRFSSCINFLNFDAKLAQFNADLFPIATNLMQIRSQKGSIITYCEFTALQHKFKRLFVLKNCLNVRFKISGIQ